MLHTLSLNLLGSSPDRYARDSANRLKAVIKKYKLLLLYRHNVDTFNDRPTDAAALPVT